jgi:hypothetical protein
MKKHVITSKTVKMATPLENNPEFTHFTNYMGVQLTMTNLQIYSDLYHNFVEWPSPNPTYSFAEKFISWKRFYDEYKETQEQIINTNLFATPPTDPRTLKNVNAPLPQDLQQLNTDTFHHFILENNPQPTQTPTDSCTDCSKDLSSPQPQNLEPIMDVDTLHDIASQHVEIIEEVLQQSNPTQAILPNEPNTQSYQTLNCFKRHYFKRQFYSKPHRAHLKSYPIKTSNPTAIRTMSTINHPTNNTYNLPGG